MDKDLERGVFAFAELFDFFDREFAGEDGAFEGEDAFDEAETIGRGDGHLGGGVNLDVGGEFDGHFGESDVLNDEGVDPAFLCEAELVGSGFEFTSEDEGVHGEEAFDPVLVEKGHELGKVLVGEVVSAQAGIEGGETKVDGVRTSGDGGAGAVPVASWGEKFGCEVGLQGAKP